jgi:hypothetical protein
MYGGMDVCMYVAWRGACQSSFIPVRKSNERGADICAMRAAWPSSLDDGEAYHPVTLELAAMY